MQIKLLYFNYSFSININDTQIENLKEFSLAYYVKVLRTAEYIHDVDCINLDVEDLCLTSCICLTIIILTHSLEQQ